MAPKAAGQKDVLILRTRAKAVEPHENLSQIQVAEHDELRKVDVVDLFLLLHLLGQRCRQYFDEPADVLARQIQQRFDLSKRDGFLRL